MSYNFKRALGISLVLYIAILVAGLAAGIISGTDLSSIDNTPDSFWYIGMVSTVVLMWLFATWYFKTTTVQPSAKSGFFFGLTAVILSAIIDCLTFTLGGMQDKLADYYGDYRFWIIVVLAIATAKVVGHMKGRKA